GGRGAGAGVWPDWFPRRDAELALEVARFSFALPVAREGGLLVARPVFLKPATAGGRLISRTAGRRARARGRRPSPRIRRPPARRRGSTRRRRSTGGRTSGAA